MIDPLAEVALSGYRIAGTFMRPVIPLVLSARAARGKEESARTGERYGRPSLDRPDGQVIWVHAASVGETNAVIPLIERLTRAGFPVLFTSTTVTSARIAAARLPPGAFHQYGPMDVPAYVDRFLDYWRPFFVIFVESELWPTTIVRLEQAVVPLVVVNGRMSDRSYRRWQGMSKIARALFDRIGLVLARTREDGDRFRALGASRVSVTGNLKFDTPPLPADEAEGARLWAAIGARPVWLAASTHEGEEQIVGEAHALLRKRWPDLLAIVVPRHPQRGGEIKAGLSAMSLRVAQRSKGEALDDSVDVYLGDTLDELGLFFRLAPVAFMGGSFPPGGGHNPIEPVQLGAAVVHGPCVQNFTELFKLLDEVSGDDGIVDAATLADAVGGFLANPETAKARVSASLAALSPLSGALDATMTALRPYLAGKYYSP